MTNNKHALKKYPRFLFNSSKMLYKNPPCCLDNIIMLVILNSPKPLKSMEIWYFIRQLFPYFKKCVLFNLKTVHKKLMQNKDIERNKKNCTYYPKNTDTLFVKQFFRKINFCKESLHEFTPREDILISLLTMKYKVNEDMVALRSKCQEWENDVFILAEKRQEQNKTLDHYRKCVKILPVHNINNKILQKQTFHETAKAYNNNLFHEKIDNKLKLLSKDDYKSKMYNNYSQYNCHLSEKYNKEDNMLKRKNSNAKENTSKNKKTKREKTESKEITVIGYKSGINTKKNGEVNNETNQQYLNKDHKNIKNCIQYKKNNSSRSGDHETLSKNTKQQCSIKEKGLHSSTILFGNLSNSKLQKENHYCSKPSPVLSYSIDVDFLSTEQPCAKNGRRQPISTDPTKMKNIDDAKTLKFEKEIYAKQNYNSNHVIQEKARPNPAIKTHSLTDLKPKLKDQKKKRTIGFDNNYLKHDNISLIHHITVLPKIIEQPCTNIEDNSIDMSANLKNKNIKLQFPPCVYNKRRKRTLSENDIDALVPKITEHPREKFIDNRCNHNVPINLNKKIKFCLDNYYLKPNILFQPGNSDISTKITKQKCTPNSKGGASPSHTKKNKNSFVKKSKDSEKRKRSVSLDDRNQKQNRSILPKIMEQTYSDKYKKTNIFDSYSEKVTSTSTKDPPKVLKEICTKKIISHNSTNHLLSEYRKPKRKWMLRNFYKKRKSGNYKKLKKITSQPLYSNSVKRKHVSSGALSSNSNNKRSRKLRSLDNYIKQKEQSENDLDEFFPQITKETRTKNLNIHHDSVNILPNFKNKKINSKLITNNYPKCSNNPSKSDTDGSLIKFTKEACENVSKERISSYNCIENIKSLSSKDTDESTKVSDKLNKSSKLICNSTELLQINTALVPKITEQFRTKCRNGRHDSTEESSREIDLHKMVKQVDVKNVEARLNIDDPYLGVDTASSTIMKKTNAKNNIIRCNSTEIDEKLTNFGEKIKLIHKEYSRKWKNIPSQKLNFLNTFSKNDDSTNSNNIKNGIAINPQTNLGKSIKSSNCEIQTSDEVKKEVNFEKKKNPDFYLNGQSCNIKSIDKNKEDNYSAETNISSEISYEANTLKEVTALCIDKLNSNCVQERIVQRITKKVNKPLEISLNSIVGNNIAPITSSNITVIDEVNININKSDNINLSERNNANSSKIIINDSKECPATMDEKIFHKNIIPKNSNFKYKIKLGKCTHKKSTHKIFSNLENNSKGQTVCDKNITKPCLTNIRKTSDITESYKRIRNPENLITKITTASNSTNKSKNKKKKQDRCESQIKCFRDSENSLVNLNKLRIDKKESYNQSTKSQNKNKFNDFTIKTCTELKKKFKVTQKFDVVNAVVGNFGRNLNGKKTSTCQPAKPNNKDNSVVNKVNVFSSDNSCPANLINTKSITSDFSKSLIPVQNTGNLSAAPAVRKVLTLPDIIEDDNYNMPILSAEHVSGDLKDYPEIHIAESIPGCSYTDLFDMNIIGNDSILGKLLDENCIVHTISDNSILISNDLKNNNYVNDSEHSESKSHILKISTEQDKEENHDKKLNWQNNIVIPLVKEKDSEMSIKNDFDFIKSENMIEITEKDCTKSENMNGSYQKDCVKSENNVENTEKYCRISENMAEIIEKDCVMSENIVENTEKGCTVPEIESCIAFWRKKFSWMTYSKSTFSINCCICNPEQAVLSVKKKDEIFTVSRNLREHALSFRHLFKVISSDMVVLNDFSWEILKRVPWYKKEVLSNYLKINMFKLKLKADGDPLKCVSIIAKTYNTIIINKLRSNIFSLQQEIDTNILIIRYFGDSHLPEEHFLQIDEQSIDLFFAKHNINKNNMIMYTKLSYLEGVSSSIAPPLPRWNELCKMLSFNTIIMAYRKYITALNELSKQYPYCLRNIDHTAGELKLNWIDWKIFAFVYKNDLKLKALFSPIARINPHAATVCTYSPAAGISYVISILDKICSSHCLDIKLLQECRDKILTYDIRPLNQRQNIVSVLNNFIKELDKKYYKGSTVLQLKLKILLNPAHLAGLTGDPYFDDALNFIHKYLWKMNPFNYQVMVYELRKIGIWLMRFPRKELSILEILLIYRRYNLCNKFPVSYKMYCHLSLLPCLPCHNQNSMFYVKWLKDYMAEFYDIQFSTDLVSIVTGASIPIFV